MYRTPLGLSGLARARLPLHQVVRQRSSSVDPICRSTRTRITETDRSLEKRLSIYLSAQPQQQQTYRKPKTLPSNSNMTFVLPGLRRGLMVCTPLILCTPVLAYQFRYSNRIRCDGPDPLTKITNDLKSNYTTEASTPILTQSGAVNPQAIRQISMGSILGVIGGLGISIFSKPLAVLIGLGIFALQVSLIRFSACMAGKAMHASRDIYVVYTRHATRFPMLEKLHEKLTYASSSNLVASMSFHIHSLSAG